MRRFRILIDGAIVVATTGLTSVVVPATAQAASATSTAPGALLPLQENSLLFTAILALVALLVSAGVVGLRRIRRRSPGGPGDKKKVGRDR